MAFVSVTISLKSDNTIAGRLEISDEPMSALQIANHVKELISSERFITFYECRRSEPFFVDEESLGACAGIIATDAIESIKADWEHAEFETMVGRSIKEQLEKQEHPPGWTYRLTTDEVYFRTEHGGIHGYYLPSNEFWEMIYDNPAKMGGPEQDEEVGWSQGHYVSTLMEVAEQLRQDREEESKAAHNLAV